jgi:hypothetical protein
MTAKQLAAQGYYPQLVKRYCDSGWIKQVAKGAYLKLAEQLTLAGALSALQQQLDLPVHLGGLSALAHFGLSQYLPVNEAAMQEWLFNTSSKSNRLPSWFVKSFSNVSYINLHLFEREIGLQQVSIDHLSVTVSNPERAILEILALVPQRFSYAHADELMEGLQLLRPDILTDLLTSCRSVKVKRLFLYLAKKHGLSCFKYLDSSQFDLGKGKRVIGAGGHYVAEYQLSVPLINSDSEDGIGNV